MRVMLKNYLVILKNVDKIKICIVFYICGITSIFSQQPPVLLSSVDTTKINNAEYL